MKDLGDYPTEEWVISFIALCVIIGLFFYFRKEKPDDVIEEAPSMPVLAKGSATLLSATPVCDDKNWVWIYTSSMANRDLKRVGMALDHCDMFQIDMPIEIKYWIDDQRYAKIIYGAKEGYTHSGAIRLNDQE